MNTHKSNNAQPLVTKIHNLFRRELAEENAWGYTRIAGELRKLGHDVSPSTVSNMLKKHGLPVSPHRNGLSWKTFIQSHLDVAWAADLFTEEVWTPRGLVTCYVLFFLHLATRRIHVAGCTPSPDAAWTRQQARNFSMILDEHTPAEAKTRTRYIIHDRDATFLPFDDVLQSENVEIVKTPFQSPWCNGYAERFVREARETLDSLILIGPGQLHAAMKTVERHHNRQRPHQGLDNAIPLGYEYPKEPAPPAAIQCEESLGGLLNYYHVPEAA